MADEIKEDAAAIFLLRSFRFLVQPTKHVVPKGQCTLGKLVE
jgi:hypothetical protein